MIKTKHSRPTQCDRLVRYLQDFNSITQMEAIQELGIMRLASRISELKKNGYEIEKRMVKGKNRYGESVSWASYSLAKAEQFIRFRRRGIEDFNYERQVTQETIADWLGLPRHQVENIIRRWGADKIVELLEIRGHYVSYEKVCEYIKFYEMG